MATSVLVVDDSPLARKLLVRAFPEAWATSVRHAGNGVEALTAYHASKPDAMFLDLNMPDMDGYQVLEALSTEGSLPPIIVLSGDIQPKARERIFALRAKGFLQKPVNAPDLSNLLRDCGIL